ASSPSRAATFGIDTVPMESLDRLRGHSATGTWTLRADGAGTLRSWSLAIQFAGDAPLASRPFSLAPRRHVAAVAHANGVGGTTFISDVRVFNRGKRPASVMAVYTPDAGGFAAFRFVIASQQIAALDDVV